MAHAEKTGSPEIEPDVNDSQMTQIGIYVVVLSSLFFGSLIGLFMYFRWETDQELFRKVGSAQSKTLQEIRAADAAALAGKDGGVSIDEAMKAAVGELNQNRGN